MMKRGMLTHWTPPCFCYGRPRNRTGAVRYRCKHKCKGECKHVCCQRAREQEASGKPREFRFRNRQFDDGPQDPKERCSNPFIKPASILEVLRQKRKADESLFDAMDDTEDFLSRLDRLSENADRVAGVAKPLEMPRRTLQLPSRSEATRKATETTSSNRLRAIELLESTRSSTDAEAATQSSQHRVESWANAQRTQAPQFMETHSEGSSASVVGRPAQSRFLKSLGTPSWLSGSDAGSHID